MEDGKVWIPTHTNRDVFDDIKARARAMRKQPTAAESVLWRKLRNRQLNGYKFRRQHSIDRFIVDFYCREARLVIEVDGPVHEAPEAIEYDGARQQFLEERGLSCLRFTNEQVINDTDSVLKAISANLSGREAAARRDTTA